MDDQQPPDINAATAVFCAAAEVIIEDGLRHARADDPHRFKTVGSEFDGGRAARRLQLDYLSGGRIRIAQLLIGTSKGEPLTVELFSMMVQGPVDAAPAH